MKIKYEEYSTSVQIEVAIEDTFEFDDERLICKEIFEANDSMCDKCFFKGQSCDFLSCYHSDRTDNQSVVFIKSPEHARNEQGKVVVEEKELHFY